MVCICILHKFKCNLTNAWDTKWYEYQTYNHKITKCNGDMSFVMVEEANMNFFVSLLFRTLENCVYVYGATV